MKTESLFEFEEETLADYAARLGINRIYVQPTVYALAYRTTANGSEPVVFCRQTEEGRWLIDSGSRFSYMFKDGESAGLFGYTSDPEDRLANSFETAEEAMERFKQLYHFIF